MFYVLCHVFINPVKVHHFSLELRKFRFQIQRKDRVKFYFKYLLFRYDNSTAPLTFWFFIQHFRKSCLTIQLNWPKFQLKIIKSKIKIRYRYIRQKNPEVYTLYRQKDEHWVLSTPAKTKFKLRDTRAEMWNELKYIHTT